MTPERDDALVVTRVGAVTTFRLNRPDQLNAITPAMHHALQAAIDAFAADDTQQIGIITGTGRAFCAGSDLKAARDRHVAGAAMTMPRSGYAGLAQRFDLDKPMIAAVNGLAVGGGFETALCCDLIIASDTARFGLTEPHVGMVAIAGSPARLARAIGPYRAAAVALTGDLIDAAEGLQLGFVTATSPLDRLDETVLDWTDRILRGGQAAVRATKALIRDVGRAGSIAEAIGDQESLPAMRAWRASGERVEGPRAFAEKRLPNWRSR